MVRKNGFGKKFGIRVRRIAVKFHAIAMKSPIVMRNHWQKKHVGVGRVLPLSMCDWLQFNFDEFLLTGDEPCFFKPLAWTSPDIFHCFLRKLNFFGCTNAINLKWPHRKLIYDASVGEPEFSVMCCWLRRSFTCVYAHTYLRNGKKFDVKMVAVASDLRQMSAFNDCSLLLALHFSYWKKIANRPKDPNYSNRNWDNCESNFICSFSMAFLMAFLQGWEHSRNRTFVSAASDETLSSFHGSQR